MVAGPRTLQVLLIAILCNLASSAQTTGSSPQNQAPEGVESGGYVLHQSIELGYRGSDVTGSQQMYDTLVNLRSGPRFLDQTLSMQSQAHDGLLFDNLFVTSFGWEATLTTRFVLVSTRTNGTISPPPSVVTRQILTTTCWQILSIRPHPVRTCLLLRPLTVFTRAAE